MASGSRTIVCQNPHNSHGDIWSLSNPLNSPSSLFLFQISLIAIVSQCITFYLRPFGQSIIVSQILGGMIFGPSILGHRKLLSDALFPAKGTVVIDTMAAFGVMFFFFLVGVKMDPATVLKTERKAVIIGLSVFLLTLAFPTSLSFLLKKCLTMDSSLDYSLPYIASSQCLTAFPVINSLLTELKILNTDIGRLALSAAMFADIIGIVVTIGVFSVLGNKNGNSTQLVWIILSAIAFVVTIVYVIRPLVMLMLSHSKDGVPVKEVYIINIFLLILVTGIVSEVIGQHYIIGPLLLGLVVPEGPPIGSALIKKMETISSGFFYPTYLAVSGLQTNLFKIDVKSTWIVAVVLFFGSSVKMLAAMIPAYYHNLPLKESVVIGLILNAKGIAELVVYNLWKASRVLADQEFALLVMSVIIITAIITPLIKYLYDPSEQYFSVRRSSIQHCKREAELRIMVCIHNIENVPTIVNLVEASYASEESSVTVIALILVELLGRARPLLVAHQPHDTLRSTSSNSTQIGNALRQYECQNQGYATVQSFTSISNFETMHDDVCRIALDRRATILIMPFHKQWEIDGGVEILNRAIQGMNNRVLEKAPCSVGILIDRGILSNHSSLLTTRSAYHVGVIFVGGADDMEALAYGARMARHDHVDATVVRFLIFGGEKSKERKRESDMIDEYRRYNMGNPRFEIIEEVIRDGIEMSECIRKFIDYFDLVLVGREHPDSTLLKGYKQWSECPELGVIGDMLASQDFVTKASVLVVQQQRIRGKLVNHNVNKAMPNEKDQLVHDVPSEEVSRASWTISMDKM